MSSTLVTKFHLNFISMILWIFSDMNHQSHPPKCVLNESSQIWGFRFIRWIHCNSLIQLAPNKSLGWPGHINCEFWNFAHFQHNFLDKYLILNFLHIICMQVSFNLSFTDYFLNHILALIRPFQMKIVHEVISSIFILAPSLRPLYTINIQKITPHIFLLTTYFTDSFLNLILASIRLFQTKFVYLITPHISILAPIFAVILTAVRLCSALIRRVLSFKICNCYPP